VVIRRIGVLSVAKIYGAMGVLIGLLIGLCFAAVAGLGSAIAGSQSSNSPMAALGIGAGFGMLSIVVFPIFYGAFTFISGLIGGALYNLLAGMVGGIEIETT